nr:hypothetical protein [Streptomyces chrestomyceticus]
MALECVHGDVEAALRGGVHQVPQLLDGARADEGTVRLEDRPQGEDSDVVQAERREGVQVAAYGVEVEIQPVVEPAVAGV